MFDALIKIGGSLYKNPAALRASLAAWAELAQRYRLLALPGGGPFADQVRAADTAFGLGDSSAHWMAILAMEQYAHLLADQHPDATLVASLAQAAAACDAGRLALLAPFTLLRQADPLPHSWEVTSDSLAAWLAGHAQVQRLVLLKTVSGLPSGAEHLTNPGQPLAQVSRSELARYNEVDPFFAHALPAGIDCWIISGQRPELLAELLNSGATAGTHIVRR